MAKIIQEQYGQNNLGPCPEASYGCEAGEQASFQTTIQSQGTDEFSRNIYILSGTNQFIVYALEIFDIKIGKQRPPNSEIILF